MLTAADYLTLPEDEQALAISRALTLKSWKHDIVEDLRVKGGMYGLLCVKCDGNVGKVTSEHQKGVPGRTIYKGETDCPVPNAIDIKDLNVAMEWFRKTDGAEKELYHIWQRYDICLVGSRSTTTFAQWLLNTAQPKHYMIAAALAAGKKK